MNTSLSTKQERLLSIDIYRGLVMFLMAAELLEWHHVASHYSGSSVWAWIHFHTSHVAWSGCSLHDLIQPSFSFLVGVALPYSLASRAAMGQSRGQQWLHVLWRSAILVLLGVFLRSMDHSQTYWTFEDTLSQIGLGYPLLFAVALLGPRQRWVSLSAILVAYWLFFALYSLPADWSAAGAGITEPWAHSYSGFAAHWNLNANAAWAFDRWFMNLFATETPFIGNEGGYSTLSFIPTLGTMILGLIAGQHLRHRSADGDGWRRLLLFGAIGLVLGWMLDALGVCPVVKKIWTPAWVFWSGGWCAIMLAGFYWLLDIRKVRGWAFPLQVIGMNSIAMYVMSWTLPGFWRKALHTHFGEAIFGCFGSHLAPMMHGAATLLILWLTLLWMHRRGIFLRV
jgi:heparan-alpha-glucosaminide N-acetyltransferase